MQSRYREGRTCPLAQQGELATWAAPAHFSSVCGMPSLIARRCSASIRRIMSAAPSTRPCRASVHRTLTALFARQRAHCVTPRATLCVSDTTCNIVRVFVRPHVQHCVCDTHTSASTQCSAAHMPREHMRTPDSTPTTRSPMHCPCIRIEHPCDQKVLHAQRHRQTPRTLASRTWPRTPTCPDMHHTRRLLAQHQWLLARRISASLRFASPALMAPTDALLLPSEEAARAGQIPLQGLAGLAGSSAVSTLPQPSTLVASAAALEELVGVALGGAPGLNPGGACTGARAHGLACVCASAVVWGNVWVWVCKWQLANQSGATRPGCLASSPRVAGCRLRRISCAQPEPGIPASGEPRPPALPPASVMLNILRAADEPRHLVCPISLDPLLCHTRRGSP